MFLANKLNKGGSLSTPDAKFNYVTMLLHGDGTNGAQNNTFLDSSTNNFTITRNGNTTQGSFSPYGSNWSNYFTGSNYLTAAGSTQFYLTGNCTVECWINIQDLSNNNGVWFNGTFGSDSDRTQMVVRTNGSIDVYSANGGSVLYYIQSATGVISAGVWYHTAFVTNGSTVTLYVNGVSVATATSAGTPGSYPNFYTGYARAAAADAYTTGYISNIRVVNGTAVYTSAFTPPTSPLTAITNTQLLTCQSNRFIDNSTNNFSLTVTGTPSVQRFNPFGASTAYSTSVIGGSGYFDGSGDYLTWPSGSSVAFGTGNFTVECWVYLGATPTTNFLFDFRDASNTTAPAFIWGNTNSGVLDWTQNAASGPNVTSTGATWNVNTWYHIAYVRSGTTGTIYQNGVSIGSATDSTNYTVTPSTSRIAARYGSPFYEFPNGYISNVRIVKGTAVYTGSFTPPTAPLTAITNTSLLLSMTNGAIFDNAMMNDLETVGNAQISTSVVKYGTGSLAFDGTGDALIGQNTPNISLSGDFTIEAWVYQTSAGQNAPQICFGDAANSGTFILYISTAQQLAYYINGTITGSGGTAAINTWHHIAMVRSGSTITTYLNGVSQNTVTASTTFSGVPYFGAALFSGTIYYGAGYMDDLRITKGYARYTSTFTPPTRALSDIGPT